MRVSPPPCTLLTAQHPLTVGLPLRALRSLAARGSVVSVAAGGAFALVWESKELLEISAAFLKLLKRSAGQQAVQLALYATVQGAYARASRCDVAHYRPRPELRPSAVLLDVMFAVRLQDGRAARLATALQGCMRAGLATATIWPVAVLNGAHFLDSAFDVACVRAKRGGKLLAHMLMHRTHGDRPVTLLGVSLGARLAFHCCLELHKHGARALLLRSAPPCSLIANMRLLTDGERSRRALTHAHGHVEAMPDLYRITGGIVEHLVLLGAPASRDRRTLEMARSVVAGRCINAYSTADWLLSLSFRYVSCHACVLPRRRQYIEAGMLTMATSVCSTKLGQGVLKSVLGLGAADFPGFEDLDCSGLVRSHGDWCKHSAQVLQGLGLERADGMGAEA